MCDVTKAGHFLARLEYHQKVWCGPGRSVVLLGSESEAGLTSSTSDRERGLGDGHSTQGRASSLKRDHPATPWVFDPR